MFSTDNTLKRSKNLVAPYKRHYRNSKTLFFSIYKKNTLNLSFAIIFLFITAIGQTYPAVLNQNQ